MATETILYYQGQPDFAGKPVAQLVDDAGFRFGQKALEDGKHTRSGWLTLTLGGKRYSAYCNERYPTITCSLVP